MSCRSCVFSSQRHHAMDTSIFVMSYYVSSCHSMHGATLHVMSYDIVSNGVTSCHDRREELWFSVFVLLWRYKQMSRVGREHHGTTPPLRRKPSSIRVFYLLCCPSSVVCSNSKPPIRAALYFFFFTNFTLQHVSASGQEQVVQIKGNTGSYSRQCSSLSSSSAATFL